MNPYQYAQTKFDGKLIKPYQSYGVRWMMTRERDVTPGGILCDEMGLGKTAQTICTMLADRTFTNTLILCPKSVVDQWATEIDRFAPSLKGQVLVHTGTKRTREPSVLKKYKVVITSLGMILPRHGALATPLHSVHWTRVVVDEAHDMRNHRSKTLASVGALKADIRWCLTATPVFNKMKDFATLMEWVGIPALHVKADIKSCVDRYVLRRTKQDVCVFNDKLQLPPCDVENIPVKMTKEEDELYRRIFITAQQTMERAELSTNAAQYVMELLTLFLRCRQAMAYPPLASEAMYNEEWDKPNTKLDILLKKIDEHPDEKSLVFCSFRGEMDAIQQVVERKVYRIDGSYAQHTRQEQIDQFHDDKTGAVFLIQIKAGGVGLNLQGATRVYINSPAWNPATEIQAIGRAHRTGQTKRVKVCRLITEDVNEEVGSIEKTMVRIQMAKSLIFESLVDNVGDMGKLTSIMGSAPNMKALKELFSKPEPQQLEEIVG